MPTNRKRRTRTRRNKIDDWRTEYLKTGVRNKDIRWIQYKAWISSMRSEDMLATWNKCKEKVLLEWVEESPGTRPYAWWLFDAPEIPKKKRDGRKSGSSEFCPGGVLLIAPRKRIEGGAIAGYEKLGTCPALHFGIPMDHIMAFWRGGDPERDLVRPRIMPKNIPGYESEVSYLKRHDLLTTAEKNDLSKRRKEVLT